MLIAEAGLNHCGNLNIALSMIDAAAWAGVDAVKFQTFRPEGVPGAAPGANRHTWVDGAGRQREVDRHELFRFCALPDYAWKALHGRCAEMNVEFMSTPQTAGDLDLLMRDNLLKRIKVGSDDATNLPFLRECATRGLPMLVSIGMCTDDDVVRIVEATSGAPHLTLMVCTSEYPCLPGRANVLRVDTLCKASGRHDVGFSDHTETEDAAIAAALFGATVFECHFTLSRFLWGPDQTWARSPESLAGWCHAIRCATEVIGNGMLEPTQAEREAAAKYQRRIP